VSLTAKLNFISHIEAREQHLDVCKVLDLAGSTVQSVLKIKNKIKEYGKIASPLRSFKLNGALCTSNH
jgi:hypothetical protein